MECIITIRSMSFNPMIRQHFSKITERLPLARTAVCQPVVAAGMRFAEESGPSLPEESTCGRGKHWHASVSANHHFVFCHFIDGGHRLGAALAGLAVRFRRERRGGRRDE